MMKNVPLQLCVLCGLVALGCERETQSGKASGNGFGPIACRIAANPANHDLLVKAAEAEHGSIVSLDGRPIGEWVLIASNSLAAEDISEVDGAVTRKSAKGTDLLLSYSANDISEHHVDSVVEGHVDASGRPAIVVTLTENEGISRFYQMTFENTSDEDRGIDRHLAVIAGGEVRSLPQINAPIRGRFIIASPTKAEHDLLLAILTGG